MKLLSSCFCLISILNFLITLSNNYMTGKLWCWFVSMVNCFCGIQAGDKANVHHNVNMYAMSINTIISLCVCNWSFQENLKHLDSFWSKLISTSMKMLIWSDLGEEEAEPKGEALDFLVRLYSNPHTWSGYLSLVRKREILDTNS